MTTEGPSARRKLELASLDELLSDIRRCSGGCRSLGNWTLAQACRHLSSTFDGSIDGFDLTQHRWKRRLLGKALLRLTYRDGIPPGYTVDPALTPPPGLNFEPEFARLEQAMVRYREHRGKLQPHPLFGRLSRDQWDRLHLFHAAHHLSFFLPSPAPEQA